VKKLLPTEQQRLFFILTVTSWSAPLTGIADIAFGMKLMMQKRIKIFMILLWGAEKRDREGLGTGQ
jgi:hypothetical protein